MHVLGFNYRRNIISYNEAHMLKALSNFSLHYIIFKTKLMLFQMNIYVFLKF